MVDFIQSILANPVAGGIVGGSFLVSLVWAFFKEAPSKIWSFILQHFTTSLFIDGTDSRGIYNRVEEHIFKYIPPSRRLRLRQLTREESVPTFGLWYFRYKHRWIQAVIYRTIRDGVPPEYSVELRTYGRCPKLLQDFVKESSPEALEKPTLYTSLGTNWYVMQKEERDFDDLILEPKQRKRLFDEVLDFKDSQEKYRRLGLLYQKGILLYGKPGTGKSTIAMTLAHKMSLHIYKLNLASLSDVQFKRLWTERIMGSTVIIDDIDIAMNVRSRTGTDLTDYGVTLDTLLAALDGSYGYVPGTVIFLTTNYPEKLDPALIRPGRIDLAEELVDLEYPQVLEMCLRFLEDASQAETFAKTVALPANPADLQIRLLRELRQPAASRMNGKIPKRCNLAHTTG